jgi:alpha-methylacyl-CoA racemase
MGPLKGVRVLEFAGIGPGPFCAMMLSDMGAEVLRIDRKPAPGPPPPADLFNPGRFGIMNRGRRSAGLDLKRPQAVQAVLKLVERADALIEGFRPGVMERLGLGPEACLGRNPRLVYGRMTGWGQEGPLSQAAGHDINYISLSGALYAIGRPEAPPVPPLNLVGDFGGGAAYLAFGLLCGVLEARSSGRGQVVDAAMVDGAASLMALEYTSRALGLRRARGANVLDGGAPYYDVYECADGKFVSSGSIEPHFYGALLDRCGVDDPELRDHQNDESRWPELKRRVAEIFRSKTREEWRELLEGTDACFAPVLDLDEAPFHPHNRARGTLVEVEGVFQPAPAPRFSRTVPEIQGPPPLPGEHTEEALREWGLTDAELTELRGSGAI